MSGTMGDGGSCWTTQRTEITDAKGVSMVLVAAGDFTMGSDNGKEDERPAHQVYLDAYYIDKYEVTNIFYKACVDASGCDMPTDTKYFIDPKYTEYPVGYIDWNMANNYCQWRGTKLPSEAQWEKAARGTDGRTYPWGEGLDCGRANVYDSRLNKLCASGPMPVGSCENGKSPYGLYDMIGNVDEWVADWFSESYYLKSPLINPLGPDAGIYRVVRGRSFHFNTVLTSTYERGACGPSCSYDSIGFRCAKAATP